VSAESIVLFHVKLTDGLVATGKAIHRHGESVLPTPQSLEIAKYPDVSGYYLFYLDGNFEQLTDTFHDDLKSAFAQAEWEFGVKESEWVSPKEGQTGQQTGIE